MIASFGDAATKDLYDGVAAARTRRFPPDVRKRAVELLDFVNAAIRIEDLKVPPSNRLHKLAGDLAEFWSVSINKQWRIIFKWDASGPSEVRIIDYH